MGKALESRRATEYKKERKNEFFNLCGFALAWVSWGYSVLAPTPNLFFGSFLLFLGVAFFFLAATRVFALKGWLAATLGVVILVGFAYFDYRVLILPQRGKEFKALLVEGYHISNDCSVIPYHVETPTWMHDQQERWKEDVSRAIDEKLDAKYAQMWRGAIVVGLAKDVNENGYRCTDFNVKLGALEKIVSIAYDPNIKHVDYAGPVYRFEGQP